MKRATGWFTGLLLLVTLGAAQAQAGDGAGQGGTGGVVTSVTVEAGVRSWQWGP